MPPRSEDLPVATARIMYLNTDIFTRNRSSGVTNNFVFGFGLEVRNGPLETEIKG